MACRNTETVKKQEHSRLSEDISYIIRSALFGGIDSFTLVPRKDSLSSCVDRIMDYSKEEIITINFIQNNES